MTRQHGSGRLSNVDLHDVHPRALLRGGAAFFPHPGASDPDFAPFFVDFLPERCIPPGSPADERRAQADDGPRVLCAVLRSDALIIR